MLHTALEEPSDRKDTVIRPQIARVVTTKFVAADYSP
jgi:hypothetical protein